MFLERKKENWTHIGYVKTSWKTLGGVIPDRLAILDAVWKKETGKLGEHCKLMGVDNGFVVVKTDTSVVYNELSLRSRQILRNINKYYAKPWLKGIKNSAEQ